MEMCVVKNMANPEVLNNESKGNIFEYYFVRLVIYLYIYIYIHM